MQRSHTEGHQVARSGWLRATILGADDGVVSTGSLIVGVASASAGQHQVLVAGIAAEIALGEGDAGDIGLVGVGFVVVATNIVGEEEELVLFHRTADIAAPLVVGQVADGGGEKARASRALFWRNS